MKALRAPLLVLLATGLAHAAPPAAPTTLTAHAAPAAGSINPAFEHELPNVPGKSLVAVEVAYPPGGSTPSHRHARSAFIFAYVVSGSIVSQVEGGAERTYHAGESFYEVPGAHHLVSRNASQTEPAKLLAVFVVDTSDKTLTTLDR